MWAIGAGTMQVPVMTTSPVASGTPCRTRSLASQVSATRGSPSAFAPLPGGGLFAIDGDDDRMGGQIDVTPARRRLRPEHAILGAGVVGDELGGADDRGSL